MCFMCIQTQEGQLRHHGNVCVGTWVRFPTDVGAKMAQNHTRLHWHDWHHSGLWGGIDLTLVRLEDLPEMECWFGTAAKRNTH